MSSTQKVYSAQEAALNDIQHVRLDEWIIVDFDETLFLRNSTQEYLKVIQPQAWAAIVLIALNYVKPWQWFSRDYSDETRDWYRVFILTLLCPWSLLLWQKRAKELARHYENFKLTSALIDSHNEKEVIVASNGFRFIIQPILKQFRPFNSKLIACRFLQGLRDRKRGKYALLNATLGKDATDRSILITDSEDDRPVLDQVAKPHLVVWEDARCVSMLATAYIPLFYMERVKKRNNKFIQKVIINEFLPLLLLLSWPSPNPILHGTGLAFLLFSFWCIYEVGYMENDLVAEQYEKHPTLSKVYVDNKARISFSEPWFWAIAASIPGLFLWSLIELNGQGALLLEWISSISSKILIWSLALFALRLLYWVYNYIDEKTRVWLYPVLQIFKFAVFMMFAPASYLVVAYFSAQVFARWIPYLIYRNSNLAKFPSFPIQFSRLLILSFLLIPFALAQGVETLMTGQMLAVLFISLYRAKTEFRDIKRKTSFHRPEFSKPWKAIRFALRSVFSDKLLRL